MKATFSERLELILKKLGMTQKELADLIGVNYSTVSSWKNRATPKLILPRLQKLIDEKGINPNFILYGDGDIFTEPLPYIREVDSGEEIPVSAIDFFATISPAMSDVLTLSESTFTNIPMFSKGEFAIQVTGNSMKGYINNADWIVIRRINNKNLLIFGECYLVITRDDNLRTVKFVNEDKEKPDCWWLTPYNVQQFDSQRIRKDDILEIYLVIGLLRRIGA